MGGASERNDLSDAQRGLLPLVVDLDRTILRTDVGLESLVALFFQAPSAVFLLPFWVLHGLAYTKRKIQEHVKVDFAVLPENEAVVSFVRAEAERGRQVILVTASDQAIADQAASRFGCFSEAIGSDGVTNLKGSNKARYLIKRFGAGKYVYVGDSSADCAVWKHAAAAVVVDYKNGARTAQAKKLCALEKSFTISGGNVLKNWARQLRFHQWSKNLLLILPLILAHQISDGAKLSAAFFGMLAFSLLASAVYILNDLSDLSADRSHPRKRFRPLASGTLKIESALLMTVALFFCVALLLIFYVPQMTAILALYFAITCIYTWWGKEQLGLDVMMLAALYCIRIVAGGIVANVALSQWLLMFAGFLFLSLACVKRVSELAKSELKTSALNLSNAAASAALPGLKRRAYSYPDMPVLTAVGSGAGLLSVLICALYFSSAEVTALYKNPTVLFSGVLPIMTFWMFRMWLLAGRGSDELEDPVLYAVTDKLSLVCAALCGVLVWAAC